jgi:membrane glycosyltransferase
MLSEMVVVKGGTFYRIRKKRVKVKSGMVVGGGSDGIVSRK